MADEACAVASNQTRPDRPLIRRGACRRAIGGKLLGAGDGGFLLLLVPPEKQDRIAAALPDLRRVPFEFDRTGSTPIFYNPS
jgi:D-glycero-alpha-D-manno-heptose-7-phosphate kinase